MEVVLVLLGSSVCEARRDLPCCSSVDASNMAANYIKNSHRSMALHPPDYNLAYSRRLCAGKRTLCAQPLVAGGENPDGI